MKLDALEERVSIFDTRFQCQSSSSYNKGHAMPAKFVGVGVGVAAVLVDDRGRVLVGRRKGSHGAGLLALPGGHLEEGETWQECAVRELKEETGLVLDAASLVHVFTSNDRMPEGKHYITIFVAGPAPKAPPKNLEPEKCNGWEFLSLPELKQRRDELFMPLRQLAESGWTPRELASPPRWSTAALSAAALGGAALGAGAVAAALAVVFARRT